MYFFYVLINMIMVHNVLTKSSILADFLNMNNREPENEIVDILASKGYLPKEEDSPKLNATRIEPQNKAEFFLSKLSDQELIKLLHGQSDKNIQALHDLLYDKKNITQKPDTKVTQNSSPVFRLDNREVQQNTQDYLAWRKLKNLLNVLPQQLMSNEETIDNKKELLFDMLVSQLKSLCCKKSIKKQRNSPKLHSSNSKIKRPRAEFPAQETQSEKSGEFLFLIINDEIESKPNSDEIVFVDPETLEKDSNILLLGSLGNSPLSDEHLKLIMNRLTSELSKPDYISLLQQLSDGTLSGKTKSLEKFVFGPSSRRYIKPHRCNYQSKLARVFGGPRWLICSGYLNLNTASPYD